MKKTLTKAGAIASWLINHLQKETDCNLHVQSVNTELPHKPNDNHAITTITIFLRANNVTRVMYGNKVLRRAFAELVDLAIPTNKGEAKITDINKTDDILTVIVKHEDLLDD